MWRRRWWLTQEEILIVGILWRRHHVTSTTLTFRLLLFPRLLSSFCSVFASPFPLFALLGDFICQNPLAAPCKLQPLCPDPRYLVCNMTWYISSLTSLHLYWNSNGDDIYWVSKLDEENLSDRLILSYTEDSYDKNHPKPILPRNPEHSMKNLLMMWLSAC